MSETQVVSVGQETSIELRRRPRPQFDELKSERVQEPLTAAEVSEHLRSMPGWKTTPGCHAISRTRLFPEVRVAAAYVTYISEFAETVKQTVSVAQWDKRVTVMLRSPLPKVRRGGITEAVLDLAKQIC
jgi:pterin-4a-carbinolamine dehydratase